MADEWRDYADGWDDEPGTRAYADAAFSSLLPVLDRAGIELPDARVIDFGCGTGLLTEHLVGAGATVMAVDSSDTMLTVLRDKIARSGWTTVTASTDLASVAGDADLVVCSSVCSFLDDYPAAAAQLAGLLRPGGLFVQWDWEREEAEDHGLTRTEITVALAGAGLDCVEVATAFEVAVEMDDQAEEGGPQSVVMRPLIGHGQRTTTA